MNCSIVSIDLVERAGRSETLKSIPRETLVRHVLDYGRFLLLAKRHPEEAIAPTKNIDEIWHLHMQNPRAYYADCMNLFGEILDHDGGFGATEEEAPMLMATFKRTAQLWEAAYGESYIGAPGGDLVKCWHNCVSRCQRACKSIRA
jgi:hypothetical protein